ncbi:MAG: YsnF/AvaK domain-containing protein [Pseudomonadota bacterium]
MPQTVIGLFKYDDAEHAVEALVDEGWDRGDIELVGSRQDQDKRGPGLFSWFGGDKYKYEAEYYSDAIRQGQALVAVDTADDRAETAADVMTRFHPIEMHAAKDRGGRPEGEGRQEATIPVTEEEVSIGKRAIERGGVRIYTRVVERPVSEDVTLHEERVHVEREPADRPVTAADRAFEERSVEFTETAEEPVVSKRARVVEEVKVSKEEEEHEERVEDTERRTDVEVQPIPGQPRPDRHPRP